LQFQADILDTPVSRPVIPETTALGAAYAAGLAVGVWKDFGELKAQWKLDRKFESGMNASVRSKYVREWSRAVEKSKGWVVAEEAVVAGGGGEERRKGLLIGGLGLAVGLGLGWYAGNRKK